MHYVNEHQRVSGRAKRVIRTALAAVTVLLAGPTLAAAGDGDVAIELNKLEPQGADCRAYFVINNTSDKAYDALKLDFILFRPDGIIDKRFAVQLAPLKANKRTVKLFDVSGTSCDEVGSFLINDAMECKAGTEDIPDCLQGLSVSSRTDNELSK
ncbi:MAG: hypothetical protein AAF405_01475 [Pseudomonadota bacterium]